MSSDEQRLQPWQVFHAANHYLRAEAVARIFNREVRSAYNWGQDPAYTEHRCRNPLELLHTLFGKMADIGLGYVARAAIRYLESAITHDAAAPAVVEPKATITEEVLADFVAVGELQRVINSGAPMHTVRTVAEAAIAEIERTVARVAKDQ